MSKATKYHSFSTNHVRKIKSKMETQFGIGMVDLFHPVTGEFNHEAVIDRRGGRRKEEVITTEKSLGIH